jgi:hypothetical protein
MERQFAPLCRAHVDRIQSGRRKESSGTPKHLWRRITTKVTENGRQAFELKPLVSRLPPAILAPGSGFHLP